MLSSSSQSGRKLLSQICFGQKNDPPIVARVCFASPCQGCRTAVPFRAQTTPILSCLSPNGTAVLKGLNVKRTNHPYISTVDEVGPCDKI